MRGRYTKQPRVGEEIETSRFGVVTVDQVFDHGLRLNVTDEAGNTHAMTRAAKGTWVRRLYFVRRAKGDRLGWTGPITPRLQAEKERDAWLGCGWSAGVVDDTPQVRDEVRKWERSRA